MLKNKIRLTIILCVLAVSLLLYGCAGTGLRGYAQPDGERFKNFRNYQYNANYNYYLYGAGNNYYALLGLNPQYTVPIHKMWKAMDINDPEMHSISNFLWERFPMYSRAAYRLIDPFGQEIGELYTSVTFSYAIEEDNSLTFYIDTPWMRDWSFY